MTPEQKAAFVNAQVACAMAEIAAMQAHDRWQRAVGTDQFYTEEAYSAVPDKFGIGHNAVITFFQD